MAATQVAPGRRGERVDLPAPRHLRPFGMGRETVVQYGGLLLIAVLVLAPVIPTLYQSILDRPLYEAGGALTLHNYVALFTEAGFGKIVLNTVYFSVLTTVFTLLLAVPMAIIIVRTRVPGAKYLGAMMQFPFFISSLVLAFGWITMYGPAGFVSTEVRQLFGGVPWNLYSIPGMALTEAVAVAPIAYLFCANALRQSDASLESAAQTCGASPTRILRSIILPLLRPPVLYSSLLVISISLESLSVPLLYGRPVGIEVFSSFLYTHGLHSIHPDYGVLGAASVIILAVTLVLVTVQGRMLKNAQRFVSVRGKAVRPRTFELGWFKWVCLAFVGFYVLFGAVIPIGGLILRSFSRIFTPLRNPFTMLTTDNYALVFRYHAYTQSIYNSIIVAAVGAVLISTIAVLAVLVSRRSSFRFARGIEYLSLLPQAMPGIIVGIGYFFALAYAPLGIGDLIQGTLWAIIIAFGIRALPSGFGSIAPSIMQLGKELDDAARISGADWVTTFTRVLGRLILPSFAGALILTFVAMFKEYTPAVFLATADTNVIGTTQLELWVQGNTGSVAALATVQVAITAVFVLIASQLLRGRKDA